MLSCHPFSFMYGFSWLFTVRSIDSIDDVRHVYAHERDRRMVSLICTPFHYTPKPTRDAFCIAGFYQLDTFYQRKIISKWNLYTIHEIFRCQVPPFEGRSYGSSAKSSTSIDSLGTAAKRLLTRWLRSQFSSHRRGHVCRVAPKSMAGRKMMSQWMEKIWCPHW